MTALLPFEDPWEQRRLLSDADRNAALVGLLERRAPGKRVLEVGCGTGVWSVLAGKLGATRVVAVEPTPLHALAARLVADNGLGDVVRVMHCKVEHAAPEPVDLAFSELLNADPFYEGVVPAMRSARRWLAPGGLLAPARLRVFAALARENDPAREARAADREVAGLGSRFGLRVDAVRDWLRTPGATRAFAISPDLASAPAPVWDLALGGPDDPAPAVEVTVTASSPGPVAAAVLWFEADYDDALRMSNPPGVPNHWGTLVFGFPDERGLRQGEAVRLRIALGPDGKVRVDW